MIFLLLQLDVLIAKDEQQAFLINVLLIARLDHDSL